MNSSTMIIRLSYKHIFCIKVALGRKYPHLSPVLVGY